MRWRLPRLARWFPASTSTSTARPGTWAGPSLVALELGSTRIGASRLVTSEVGRRRAELDRSARHRAHRRDSTRPSTLDSVCRARFERPKSCATRTREPGLRCSAHGPLEVDGSRLQVGRGWVAAREALSLPLPRSLGHSIYARLPDRWGGKGASNESAEAERQRAPAASPPTSGRGTVRYESGMSPPGLEQIVKRDGRLNLLSCLVANGSLSASELAARTGDSLQAVSYWLRLLDRFDLVDEDEVANRPDEVIYSATLDEQPKWVREAVRQHRPRSI